MCILRKHVHQAARYPLILVEATLRNNEAEALNDKGQASNINTASCHVGANQKADLMDWQL